MQCDFYIRKKYNDDVFIIYKNKIYFLRYHNKLIMNSYE